MLPPIATIEIGASVMSLPLEALEDVRVRERLLAGRHRSAYPSFGVWARESDATESITGPEIHEGVTADARARCRLKTANHAQAHMCTGGGE